jgi:hypothetical protein
MACCGGSRAPKIGVGARPLANLPASAGLRRYQVMFEYVGATALTAIGPVSGKRYRFDHPGAVMAVDPRDRPGLAAVPNLRAV